MILSLTLGKRISRMLPNHEFLKRMMEVLDEAIKGFTKIRDDIKIVLDKISNQ